MIDSCEFVNASLLEYIRNHKSIICYGAGKYGRIVRNYLYEHQIDISFFVVSNKPEYDKVLGVKVIALPELEKYDERSGLLICVSSKYKDIILQNLKMLDICDYFDISEDDIQRMDDAALYDNMYEIYRNRVLLYHRVEDSIHDIWNISMQNEMFESQLEYLKNHYNIVRFEDIDYNIPGNKIAVTVDDGYYDAYKNIKPIIDKLQIPITIFVSTRNIGTNREFWWDEIERIVYSNIGISETICWNGHIYNISTATAARKACFCIREELLGMDSDEIESSLSEMASMTDHYKPVREEYRSLNLEELIELDRDPMVTIGSHTVTHTRLSSLSYGDKEYEILESKRVLENILGHRIDSISFPFGGVNDYDMDCIRIALEGGYKYIAAVQNKYSYGDIYKHNPDRLTVSVNKSGINSENYIREISRLLILTN